MPASLARRVSEEHKIIKNRHFVFLRNTHSGPTCAMIFPVMPNQGNVGVGEAIPGRRAKRSGTGVPPVCFCHPVSRPQPSTINYQRISGSRVPGESALIQANPAKKSTGMSNSLPYFTKRTHPRSSEIPQSQPLPRFSRPLRLQTNPFQETHQSNQVNAPSCYFVSRMNALPSWAASQSSIANHKS